jgi:hypothetical protein
MLGGMSSMRAVGDASAAGHSGAKKAAAPPSWITDLPDARMRAVTAYALRFMKQLQPATLAHIRQRLALEPEDAPTVTSISSRSTCKGQRRSARRACRNYSNTRRRETRRGNTRRS